MTIFNAIGSISSDALSPWSVAELYHDGRQTGPAALHAILIRRPVNCCGRPTDRPASARRNLQMWLLASKSNWRVYVVRLVYELLASAPSQVPGPERSGASVESRCPIYIGASTERNLHHVLHDRAIAPVRYGGSIGATPENC